MGRYYYGDIDGKFWFALQDSNAADRFGSTGYEPQMISYYFGEDHLDGVKKEIASIEEKLGGQKKVIDDFLSRENSWNEEMIKEAGFTRDELKEYADLLLGIKIRNCIESHGCCEFNAEY